MTLGPKKVSACMFQVFVYGVLFDDQSYECRHGEKQRDKNSRVE
jgi:hypothetical protein